MNHSTAFDFKNNKEELWNAITHGIGFLLSIPASILLILQAVNIGNIIYIISYSIFGFSLMLLFLMSTLLHSMPKKVKRIFSIFDHSSIYVLIAGTYTPFLLIAIGGTLGTILLIVIWSLAVFGIIFKCLFIHRYEKLSLALYISMGWLIIFAIKPLYEYVQLNGFLVLLTGGILYTVGAFFYACRKIPYNHAIWHIFVLLGSACMVYSVYAFL